MAAVIAAATEQSHVLPLAALSLFAETSHQGHRPSSTTFRPGTTLAISNTATGMPVCMYDSGTWSCCTGKERDAETGLDYFGARYFSAAQGRFTSPDWSEKPEPVPYAKVIDPQTLNLYAYVRNNPLRSRDADGHEVDLTGDDKAKAEEQKRITANASKKGEAALFKTVTDKSGKTRLVLDKAAAADFKGTHSAGYNLLVGAIDAKPVATVEMVDHDSTTTLYANGNATVHLDWNVSGIDKVVPLIDPKSPQKNQMPFSIIAGHELLGHALANMLHVPGANLDGPGTPVWGVEQTLRQEQGLIPRPDNMP
jgi:RHS repeat-associated protein